MRWTISSGAALACAALLGAGCSLLIDVEGCRSDEQCPAGERCVAEACVLDDRPSDADPTPDMSTPDAEPPDGELPDAAPPDEGPLVDADLSDAVVGCVDDDGDDFGPGCLAGPDCDDTDPDRFPGADERCDGEDDDCDGRVDEDALEACYTGPEGTRGVGLCAEGVKACGEAQCLGQVTPETATAPGDPPCDGLDGDCDGAIDEADEGCTCEGQATQGCYGGPAGTLGVGRCVAGTQTCAGGNFGACEGDVPPAVETCNGFDDDCDGVTDEGVTNRCGACGQLPPEVCNGLDDDCDGVTDEGLEGVGDPCEAGLGQCARAGELICDVARGLVLCNGLPGTPDAETCNGVDDDCDGATDEGLTAPACERTDGLCWAAVARCGGAEGWLPCTLEDYRGFAADFVESETGDDCNGLDDDCDGGTDEACLCEPGAACGQVVGVCTAGGLVCPEGEIAPTCDGAVGPTVEVCNNLDDDCDGATDEGIEVPCGPDAPRCQGLRRCINGELTGCIGAVEPVEESCNGADDDCDGQLDERLERGCGNGTGTCQQGRQLCRGGLWGACLEATRPGVELCDGEDNDCDGLTDERLTRPCGQDEGLCRRGVQQCEAGEWAACSGEITPQPEACDGLDNDCDAVADEMCEE